MAPKRILYQFPVSHYCEKTRWHLTYKGLPFREKNLFPGAHRITSRRRAGVDTLPVLRDGNRWLGDSSRIALYLEELYPQAPLVPEVGQGRRHVLELEEMFDRTGVHVRRWMYGHLLDRPEILALMLEPYRIPALGKRLMTPLLRDGIRRLYKVEPQAVAQSEGKLLEALERVDRLLEGNANGFLHDGQFTLADVTAAAMLAPLVAPPGTPWAAIPDKARPKAMRDFVEAMKDRPVGQWVLTRYARNRKGPPHKPA